MNLTICVVAIGENYTRIKTVPGLAVILTLAFVLAAQYRNAPDRPSDFRDAVGPGGAVEQLQNAAPADQEEKQPGPPAIPSPQAVEPESAVPEIPAWHSAAVESPGVDELNFWDGLYKRGGSMEDVCGYIALPIEYGYGAENIGGITGSAKRRFRKYYDGTLVLVDEMGLKVGLGSPKIPPELADTPGVSIMGGVRLEGSSMVIRPLGGTKACGELKEYVNIFKYKTVLPFNAERFAAMENREIWKLPLTLWTGFTPSVSGVYGNARVTVSFGVEGQLLPSMSLAKISDRELRVRLRIDQARIISYGASAGVAAVPVVVGLDKLAGALAAQLGSVVGGAAPRIIAEIFEEYTHASLGLTHSAAKGRKVLLEFILDPQNPEQMGALVKLLKDGDLRAVGALAKVAGMAFLPGHNNTTDETELQGMQAEWNKKLGIQPAYSGQSSYQKSATGFALHIPVITDYGRTSGHNYQTAHTPGSGETLHVHENFRKTSHSRLYIPSVLAKARHNSERTISVYNSKAAGSVSEPVMVYEQLEGTRRRSENRARSMLDSVNEIMRFVGVQGKGDNSTAAIPVNDIQPQNPGAGAQRPVSGGKYNSAFMSFAVLFNENAVRDIIASPAAMIVKAYANSLDAASGAMMEKVLPVPARSGDAAVKSKKWRDVERVLGVTINALRENQNVMDQVYSLCRTAAQIVADVARIRAAPDWETRSARLSEVIAGGGKSGLRYADILKVFVQVVDPKDVAAEITYRTIKKSKGRDDVSVQYSYNRNDNPAFAGVDGARKTLDRFDNPARLYD